MKEAKTAIQEQLSRMTDAERRAFLEDNSAKVETDQLYRKYLTEEERADAEKDFAKTAIRIEVETEVFNAQKALFKEKETELKKRNKTNLTAIRSGYVEQRGSLFYFDDQDAGEMEVYDEAGNLVEKRRLRPDERQSNILSLNRKSS